MTGSKVRSVPRLCLNRAEVAMSIGVSPNTVDEMVREGFLPKPRRWHTRKVWIVSEIEAAMSEWPTDESSKPDEDDEWRMTV